MLIAGQAHKFPENEAAQPFRQQYNQTSLSNSVSVKRTAICLSQWKRKKWLNKGFQSQLLMAFFKDIFTTFYGAKKSLEEVMDFLTRVLAT